MRRDAALVAIGTELLADGRPDTNGTRLGQILAEIGIRTMSRTILPDVPEIIGHTLCRLSKESCLVIVTGGLGPTQDDVTREGVAQGFGLSMQTDADALVALRDRCRASQRPFLETMDRQAMVPEGAELIPNPLGSAPGLLLVRPGDCLVFLLPGVPEEMIRMVRMEVLPRLKARARTARWKGVSPDEALRTMMVKAAGLTESEVQQRLNGFMAGADNHRLTLLASPGEITVIVRSEGDDHAGAELQSRLGAHIFTQNPDEALEHAVGRLLGIHNATLAIAESCTGGLLGSLITRVPGASEWFLGGWVTYSSDFKSAMLGLSPDTLSRYGSVSEETCRAMAISARKLSGATYGLSVTGIAGPNGGTPVGLVWLGLAGPAGCRTRHKILGGGRETIRLAAARGCLDLLRHQITLE